MVLPVKADLGAFIQALLHMAISAKHDVSLCRKRDLVPETKVENGPALRRREVQRSVIDFLRIMDVGRMVLSPRADTESEASAAEPGCPRFPGWLWVRPREDRRRVSGLPPADFGLVEFGGAR